MQSHAEFISASHKQVCNTYLNPPVCEIPKQVRDDALFIFN